MNSIQNLFNISEVGEAAVSSSSSGPASSLSAKMEAEGVRNGQVMFHSCDSLAVFVRAVESSVFAHLFETEREEAAKSQKPIKSRSCSSNCTSPTRLAPRSCSSTYHTNKPCR